MLLLPTVLLCDIIDVLLLLPKLFVLSLYIVLLLCCVIVIAMWYEYDIYGIGPAKG